MPEAIAAISPAVPSISSASVVYLEVPADSIKDLQALQVGGSVRVVLRGTVKEISERSDDDRGTRGTLVLEAFRWQYNSLKPGFFYAPRLGAVRSLVADDFFDTASTPPATGVPLRMLMGAGT